MTKIFDVMGNLLYESSSLMDETTIRNAIGEGTDLKFAHLSQRNLQGLDLSYCKLVGARFVSANMSGTECVDADFAGADFTCANLRGANLRWANLRGANLRAADLSGADLYKADLRGANITRAKLAGDRLDGAKLENARIYASVDDFKVTSNKVYEEAKLEFWALMGLKVEKISWGKLWASGDLWEYLLVLKNKYDKEINNG